jgi:hypothetical protein
MVMLRVIQTIVPKQDQVVRTGDPPQTRAGFSISDSDRVGLEGDKTADLHPAPVSNQSRAPEAKQPVPHC